jgi:hypothetical protein
VGFETEVRRLIPAVAGPGQRADDALEVPLHRDGLPGELAAVRMREARAGFCLELVTRQVLWAKSERILEVAREMGGALARDPIDEIERDVVKLGITEMVDGAPDVVGTRAPLEHREQVRPEALRSERDPRDAGGAQRARECGSDRLGVRLHRQLFSGG